MLVKVVLFYLFNYIFYLIYTIFNHDYQNTYLLKTLGNFFKKSNTWFPSIYIKMDKIITT